MSFRVEEAANKYIDLLMINEMFCVDRVRVEELEEIFLTVNFAGRK
jgi:hypothetical protein